MPRPPGYLLLPSLLMAALTAQAQVVHYRIVGQYQAKTVIAFQENGGQAMVRDKVELELTWDSRQQQVVGDVTIRNFKSETRDLQNVETSCPAPSPKGDYEHLTVTEAKVNGAGTLGLKGTRAYPDIEVTAYCRGSWAKKKVAARTETVIETLAMLDGEVSDFSVQAGPWTWTYTGKTVRKR